MKKIFCILIFMFLVVGINQVRAESSCPFDQEMGLGTENSKVGVLQSFMLNTLKIYSGPVTNYFGPLTMASVKIFQESSGLLQTGKVDLITANSLCKIYLSYKTSEPLNTGSGECFIKTLGIQKGYFEEANEEVKNLQLYLNQKGYYPENVISGYFGIKTEAALKAFQKANNISQSGIIDDITFKVICGYESNQSSYCPFVTDNLSIGYFEEANNEVKALQMILSKLSLLEEKNITGYFGKITSEAVKSMQSKVGLISTGVLNLETRQALCKMINLPLKGESSGNPYESSNSNIDVTISDVGVLPDKIDVNTKTAIVIKIKNIGSEDSKAIKSSLYINDKEINKTNVSVIKPNDEVIAIVQNWTCEQKGIYALKVFIDSDNDLIEKNKYNNVSVVPINCGAVAQQDYKYSCNSVTQKCEIDNTNGKLLLSECQKQCVSDSELPDLTIEQFSAVKTTLKPDEVTNITIIEKKIGKSAAGYHKANLIINGQDNKADWSPLEAGSKNTFNQITFKCVTPGTYTLKIVTDYDNAIKELNENNNSSILEIKCMNKEGEVPANNPGNNGSNGGTGGGNGGTGGSQDTGSGSGGDSGSDTDSNKNNSGGTKSGTGKIGTDTGPVRSGGLYLSWFQMTPNDCYNCPSKRCGGNTSCGGNFSYDKNKYGVNVIIGCPGSACIDGSNGNSLPFYRESPHKMRVTYNIYNYNNLYKPGMSTACEIDLGDGNKHDCSFTGFAYNGKDVGGENNSFIEFYHSYINNTDKPIAICPTINLSDSSVGDKLTSKLTNAFCDSFCKEGQEDSTKCLFIYPAGWSFQAKDKAGNPNAYNVASLTASPNPGKVGDTITFRFQNSGMREDNIAWCRVEFGDGASDTFECKSSGTFTHVYKYPSNYTVKLSVDEAIDFLDCGRKTLSVVIKTSDGKEPIKDIPKKYGCSNYQCVLDEKGIYNNDKCDGKCTKPATDPVNDKSGTCNEDWCYVCDPSKELSGQCIFLNKTDYTLDKYKSFKRFSGILNCRGKDSPCFSKYECDATSKMCKITSKDKTGNGVYESYAECSEKCGSFAYPTNGETEIQNPGNWFTNLISGIFSTKGTDLQVQSTSTTIGKKYTCVGGVCKESSTGVSLDKCMSSCLGVINLFEGLNLNSSSFDNNSSSSNNLNFTTSNLNFSNLNISSGSRFICDISQQKCVSSSKGEYTNENTCNANCKLNFITNNSISLDSLNLSAQNSMQTNTLKYKCNQSTGKCVEASSLDKNTFTDKIKCQESCSVSLFNGVNLNSNFNNFNLQFNP